MIRERSHKGERTLAVLHSVQGAGIGAIAGIPVALLLGALAFVATWYMLGLELLACQLWSVIIGCAGLLASVVVGAVIGARRGRKS